MYLQRAQPAQSEMHRAVSQLGGRPHDFQAIQRKGAFVSRVARGIYMLKAVSCKRLAELARATDLNRVHMMQLMVALSVAASTTSLASRLLPVTA